MNLKTYIEKEQKVLKSARRFFNIERLDLNLLKHNKIYAVKTNDLHIWKLLFGLMMSRITQPGYFNGFFYHIYISRCAVIAYQARTQFKFVLINKNVLIALRASF